MRILYLDIDSLRPDHLGCYGYHRNTSPNIDAIAKQGVRFNNYYTSDAPCLPSRTALMSGRFGIHTGVVGHGGTAADFRLEGPTRGFGTQLRDDCLPAIFRRQGYHTALFSPFAERHTIWTFYAGFKEIHNTGKGGMESAEEVTPGVVDWIQRKGQGDNWFLYVNYWDPHTPYRVPASFGQPFKDDPLPAWLTPEVLAEHRQHVGPHSAREIAMWDNSSHPRFPRHLGEIKDMTDLRQMIDGYDTGVRYADHHVGLIFEALRQAGVMEEVAIIISADHGENQGELGIYGEHGTADQITCRVPLIVRWPGCQAGTVDDTLHYNADLAPTLAELCGQPARPIWDGISMAGNLRGAAPSSHPHLVFSQCAHVCQRSVRWDDYLYIRSYHDGFHLFPEEQVFNLKDDPHEQVNLAVQHPELCREAVWRLNEWHDRMMKTMPYDTDPLWTVIQEGGPLHARGKLAKYCERLEATERGWAVPELKRRHPREFK
jgi:choline-sulfatase